MSTQRAFKSGLLALSAIALCGTVSQSAFAQTQRTRNSLLGIRLLADSYATVLKKYGPPTEISSGPMATPNAGAPARAGAAAGGGGGGKMAAMGGGGMMPGMGGGGMMPGMGGGMPPQAMAAMMGAGRPGMGGGMPQMGSGGMMPGMGAGAAGLPGFSGARGGGAGSGGMMPGMGAGAAGGANAEQAEEDSGEAYWWYTIKKRDPKNKERLQVHHMSFLFNKQGRVIQIQEYGYAGGAPTTKGVGLGDPLSKLLRAYGWSNDGERTGDNLVFRYGGNEKFVFQLVRDQVVGITLAAVK